MGAGPFLAVVGIIVGLPSVVVLELAGWASLELLLWFVESRWSAELALLARGVKPAVRIAAQAALQPFWSDSMVAEPRVTDLLVMLGTFLRASVTCLMQVSPVMPSMVMVRVVGPVEGAEWSAAEDGAEWAAGWEVWEGLEVWDGLEGLEGLEFEEGVVDESMGEAFRTRAVADGLRWCSVIKTLLDGG